MGEASAVAAQPRRTGCVVPAAGQGLSVGLATSAPVCLGSQQRTECNSLSPGFGDSIQFRDRDRLIVDSRPHLIGMAVD